MSLRSRLALIVSLMLLAGLLFDLARNVTEARERVAGEMRSTAALASELFAMILSDSSLNLRPALSDEVMNRLLQLESVRHLDIEILRSPEAGVPARPDDRAPPAPAWFTALVHPQAGQVISSFGRNGDTRILIRTDPSDEIAEAWSEIRGRIVVSLAVLVLFNAVLFFLLTRWLKPVTAFVRTLEDIERGDFSRRIPKMRLPELEQIAEKMNRLTSAMGASKSENERLARKSLMIQEQERRHLAQELHDAMGQSISAIKAMAAAITQRGQADPLIAESALKIGEASNVIYNSVKNMIGRLRPAVLDELGLAVALEQMVDDWNTYHEDAFCRLRIDGDFDDLQEEQQINVFRIVQEALTNSARHSQADSIEVALGGREVISLIVSDNGVGYDFDRVEKGMGLMNIRERVKTLHGELNISTRPREGVSIQIEFPRINKRRRRRATDVWPAR